MTPSSHEHPTPPLPPSLAEAVQAAVAQTPAPTRRGAMALRLGLLLASLVIAATVFFAYGGLRDGGAPRPLGLILATTLGSLALAAFALWVGCSRGHSMLGRARPLLLATVLGVPVALLLWKLGLSASVPDMMVRWPQRIGIPCFEISALSGLFPLLALLWLRRGDEPNHPALSGAVFGVVAGSLAWVVTDLWCPVGHVPHLVLGHVLPLVLLAVAGSLAGARWLALRWRPPADAR